MISLYNKFFGSFTAPPQNVAENESSERAVEVVNLSLERLSRSRTPSPPSSPELRKSLRELGSSSSLSDISTIRSIQSPGEITSQLVEEAFETEESSQQQVALRALDEAHSTERTFYLAIKHLVALSHDPDFVKIMIKCGLKREDLIQMFAPYRKALPHIKNLLAQLVRVKISLMRGDMQEASERYISAISSEYSKYMDALKNTPHAYEHILANIKKVVKAEQLFEAKFPEKAKEFKEEGSQTINIASKAIRTIQRGPSHELLCEQFVKQARRAEKKRGGKEKEDVGTSQPRVPKKKLDGLVTKVKEENTSFNESYKKFNETCEKYDSLLTARPSLTSVMQDNILLLKDASWNEKELNWDRKKLNAFDKLNQAHAKAVENLYCLYELAKQNPDDVEIQTLLKETTARELKILFKARSEYFKVVGEGALTNLQRVLEDTIDEHSGYDDAILLYLNEKNEALEIIKNFYDRVEFLQKLHEEVILGLE